MMDWRLVPARDLGLGPGERLRSIRRESGWIEAVFHALWGILIHAYLGICHRLRVEGLHHLPLRPPFVLVANHASHLDALALGAILPWGLRDRVFPLAAGDTFFEKGPVAAFAALLLNALPVWRRRCDRRDFEELRNRLTGEPCAFILFPEGTRTRTGRMGPFRPGIGRLVAATGVPVIPCYLRGPFEAAPPRCFFPRFRRITLTVGAPLTFEAAENSREGWSQVAADIEGAVCSLRDRA
jgi:1-acyl-sn-glycerol-3-phosphate acyltransferase